MEKLDNIDRDILRILQKDAKTVATVIADQLGMTKTPVYERIKRLEKEGYIKNYIAILDTKKIGESITVFSFVSLEAQKGHLMDEFLLKVQEFKEVMECYVVGGEFDFLLKITIRDLDGYYDFAKSKIASLPNIGAVKSAFVLNEAKNDYQYPLL
ncbi:Lrp/AsnC family transcriptional regulator [Maribacter sp. 2304DJ31-5]|uniref:Lrp/AsnC family transcriptional regulator n=1 Tax=Maribacter sp. 2304DJ31-5 TaxID=3386273 RepID=UPI0039BD1645